MENPIKSSYELLWQELKNENAKSNITFQNIMRRIIENYFKLLGKFGDDDLYQFSFAMPYKIDIFRHGKNGNFRHCRNFSRAYKLTI